MRIRQQISAAAVFSFLVCTPNNNDTCLPLARVLASIPIFKQNLEYLYALSSFVYRPYDLILLLPRSDRLTSNAPPAPSPSAQAVSFEAKPLHSFRNHYIRNETVLFETEPPPPPRIVDRHLDTRERCGAYPVNPTPVVCTWVCAERPLAEREQAGAVEVNRSLSGQAAWSLCRLIFVVYSVQQQ